MGTGTGVDAGKPQAWFAGEVVDTNNAEWMGDWVSYQVQDNGTPGHLPRVPLPSPPSRFADAGVRPVEAAAPLVRDSNVGELESPAGIRTRNPSASSSAMTASRSACSGPGCSSRGGSKSPAFSRSRTPATAPAAVLIQLAGELVGVLAHKIA